MVASLMATITEWPFQSSRVHQLETNLIEQQQARDNVLRGPVLQRCWPEVVFTSGEKAKTDTTRPCPPPALPLPPGAVGLVGAAAPRAQDPAPARAAPSVFAALR